MNTTKKVKKMRRWSPMVNTVCNLLTSAVCEACGFEDYAPGRKTKVLAFAEKVLGSSKRDGDIYSTIYRRYKPTGLVCVAVLTAFGPGRVSEESLSRFLKEAEFHRDNPKGFVKKEVPTFTAKDLERACKEASVKAVKKALQEVMAKYKAT